MIIFINDHIDNLKKKICAEGLKVAQNGKGDIYNTSL